MQNYKNELHNLANHIFELQNRINTLEGDLNAIQSDLRKAGTHLANLSNNRSYLRLNGRICRFINSSLLKGVNLCDALQDASDTFGVSAAQIETVYKYEKNRVKILEKLAKMMMVRRLKKLRYKNREIAKICGFSEKYLYELLKKDKKGAV